VPRSPEPRDRDRPCHLRFLDLPPGGWHDFDTGNSEWILLPLSGSCTVAVRGRTFLLTGRKSLFVGATDFVYTPRDAHVAIATRNGGSFALTGARCDRRLPARHQPASAVPLELHSNGHCSRRLTDTVGSGVLECDGLIATEVLMPGAPGPSPCRGSTRRTAGARTGWSFPSAMTARPTARPGFATAASGSDETVGKALRRRPRPPLRTALDSRRDRV